MTRCEAMGVGFGIAMTTPITAWGTYRIGTSEVSVLNITIGALMIVFIFSVLATIHILGCKEKQDDR